MRNNTMHEPRELFSAVLARRGYSAASPKGTDKVTTHSYGAVYDELAAKLCTSEADVDVLEIGVQHGAFLHALAEHLPRARIVGLDVSLAHLDADLDWAHPRIRVHETDATKPEALDFVAGTAFDLIVEDASHVPGDQVAHLDLFAPLLKPGGTYVLEDIADLEVRAQLDELAAKHGLRMAWHDLRHAKGRFDDVLAVFTRPDTR